MYGKKIETVRSKYFGRISLYLRQATLIMIIIKNTVYVSLSNHSNVLYADSSVCIMFWFGRQRINGHSHFNNLLRDSLFCWNAKNLNLFCILYFAIDNYWLAHLQWHNNNVRLNFRNNNTNWRFENKSDQTVLYSNIKYYFCFPVLLFTCVEFSFECTTCLSCLSSFCVLNIKKL